MSVSNTDIRDDFDSPGEARTAVDQIYRDHGNWLIAFLRRRFGHQRAEELAQDAWLRAISSPAVIREPRKFLAHLALRSAQDRYRREAVRPKLVPDEGASARAATPADAEALLLQKQIVKSLPPQLRGVFLLRSFTPMTNAEIAEHCGVSVKTVEERMTKALAICKVLLRD
jgi:RNA polymerase sigma-70 factor (ECF subfamily)